MNLTQERVQELFAYNPEDGILRTKTIRQGSNSYIGQPIGTLTNYGYLCVTIDTKRYQLHRVIWLYVYGYIPKEDLDHIDGNRTNNRLFNLREANRQDNLKNTAVHRDSSTSILGVNWDKRKSKWRATIYVNKKQEHLGYFKEIQEATLARQQANIRYGFHENHGRAV
jgi:hypothetical protein